LIEIGIPRADPPNAMLAQKNRRVRVVQQITGKMR
jgi:hypothetical protein